MMTRWIGVRILVPASRWFGIDKATVSKHKTGRRGGKEISDDQEATKCKCHTNRIKEYRIPTRIEQPILDATRTRRHRHHERNQHKHDPTKRVKNS